MSGHGGEALAAEAARIICEDAVFDYRTAKLRAAQRLGLGPRPALPDNAQIQAAVIRYQRLFGGAVYAHRLRALRAAGVSALRLLARFEPRLAGAAVSGAISEAHRVQVHCFPDQPELIDSLLLARGIPFEQDERRYRYPDGREQSVPLARFEAGEVGIDVAAFEPDDLRMPPLSPADGLPMKRLALPAAEALARIPVEAILGDEP